MGDGLEVKYFDEWLNQAQHREDRKDEGFVFHASILSAAKNFSSILIRAKPLISFTAKANLHHLFVSAKDRWQVSRMVFMMIVMMMFLKSVQEIPVPRTYKNRSHCNDDPDEKENKNKIEAHVSSHVIDPLKEYRYRCFLYLRHRWYTFR